MSDTESPPASTTGTVTAVEVTQTRCRRCLEWNDGDPWYCPRCCKETTVTPHDEGEDGDEALWQRTVSEAPPLDPRRLRVIECEADPKHPDLFYEYDESQWYPPPCYMCILHDESVRRDKAEHARHRAWHRWKITNWLMTQLYLSGIAVSGLGHRWGGYGGCRGCVVSWPKFRRGSRYYVLWVQVSKWRCLRSGHWPGEQAEGLCTKCYPCPTCGSKKFLHNDGCEWR